jgi:3-hydroxyacyl-CoA dehydrogenase/enoyl-CoA hydratase/3-hydroxybutyryl-CoA epimerase
VGQDGLATLTFDHPEKSVNVFDREVLEELEQTVDQLAERDDIRVLVLISGKKTNFIAGADVDMIADVTDPMTAEAGARFGQRVFGEWSELPFPTVAAIHGSSMGGGTEIALASTYRVVSDADATKIALPEVKLGIIPGWGGSTRLPRLIGIANALDYILTGKTMYPKQALKLGFADALLPAATFRDQVREFALSKAGSTDSKGRSHDRPDLKEILLEKNPLGRKILFDQARKKTLEQTAGHYPAPLRALEVVKTGIEEGLQAGLAAEARALGELATSPVAKSLIHVFQLMEAAKRTPGLPGGEARQVDALAVVGAGAMGGGIAQLAADERDLPVRMKDIDHGALALGLAQAAKVFQKKVDKRRLTAERMKRKMALIRGTLDYSGFHSADVVVEAIVEKLPIKQKVFAEIAAEVRDDTVLASNTSSLSIEEIGKDTPHRERVVGMHFFNPVDRMPLVEVIAAPQSAPWAVNTVIELSRKLGKTPVLVKDEPGFLVNRLLMFSMGEALWLLDAGHTIENVDQAMDDWGMPMGPMALTDEVGIDVAVKVAHILQDAFGDRLPMPEWLDRMIEAGRLGKKSGLGFYLYEKGKRTEPDQEVYELLGLDPRIEDPHPQSLVERMVLRMVDEAARCLDEQVVRTPGELDLAMIMGTGFPPFRGGLCRWADQQGLGGIVENLERLASTVGPRFAPSDALREAAAAGGFYAHWGSLAEGEDDASAPTEEIAD